MSNACTDCSVRKRGCDRARPKCGLCVRTGRGCTYEDAAEWQRPDLELQQSTVASNPVPDNGRPDNASETLEMDSFQYANLRNQAVTLIREELVTVFGSIDRIPDMIERYFRTVHQRIPIISKKRFLDHLPLLSGSETDPSYLVFCLCIRLVQQMPSSETESMRTSSYLAVKKALAVLVAAGDSSLNLLQAMVLVTFYEIGHAIQPAASMSLAECAKLARVLNLHRSLNSNTEDSDDWLRIEEQRRVWWVIHNLDRYLALCSGDALFSTSDPKRNSPLPVEDHYWANDIVPPNHDKTLATPSDINVGQLARECQVSHLAGRVTRHVFDPTTDQEFQVQEAIQLERALKSFLPFLIEEQHKFGKFCCAIAICSSALFTLYYFSPAWNRQVGGADADTDAEWARLRNMEELSTRMAVQSRELYIGRDDVEYETLSPLATYCFYQSAVVQLGLWRRTGNEGYKQRAESLKEVLGIFNRRWRVAGAYLRALDAEEPAMMLPSAGFCLNG